jgi:hypothetical protein
MLAPRGGNGIPEAHNDADQAGALNNAAIAA